MKTRIHSINGFSGQVLLLCLVFVAQAVHVPAYSEAKQLDKPAEPATEEVKTATESVQDPTSATTPNYSQAQLRTFSEPMQPKLDDSNENINTLTDQKQNDSALKGAVSKTEKLKSRNRIEGQVQVDNKSATKTTSNSNDWLSTMIGRFANMPGSSVQLNGNIDLRTLLGGLSRAAQMSSEDYRKLEYGILGLAASKWVGGTYYTVREVLPDCPAALAGIKPGDVILQANHHVFTKDDDQRVYWQTVAGKAGTPVDIVVSRDEQAITFHLIRMNIEDIKDDNIRQIFERKLSLLGPPTNADEAEIPR